MHACCQLRTKSPTLSENATPQCNYLASVLWLLTANGSAVKFNSPVNVFLCITRTTTVSQMNSSNLISLLRLQLLSSSEDRR